MTRRRGFTVFELVVVIAVIGVLVAIILPAVQAARSAAFRLQCDNNLKQIGLALHGYHNTSNSFPPGVSSSGSPGGYGQMAWPTRLLPYLEQEALWELTQAAYASDPTPFDNPPHYGLATPIAIFSCPADGRALQAQATYNNLTVALTDYVGVSGTNLSTKDGVLFLDSAIRLTDILDGTSTTLLVGERPPSTDFWYGWWYAGVGQLGSGSGDMLLGVREVNVGSGYAWFCAPGPYHFTPGRFNQECDLYHYWSPHAGGGHFLMADGSARFLAYDADAILPALATRAGGEGVATID